jgi:hypothetical protein
VTATCLAALTLSMPRPVYCAGGLPDGWLSTQRTFKGLDYLDLSDNKLGCADAACRAPLATVTGASGWCKDGLPAATSGWCAPAPLPGTMDTLTILDISNNNLNGESGMTRQGRRARIPERRGRGKAGLQWPLISGESLVGQAWSE